MYNHTGSSFILSIMLTKREIIKIRNKISNQYERLPAIFKTISDSGRLLIFEFIFRKSHVVCVIDVAIIFKISLSTASRRLCTLETSGLLTKKLVENKVCYTVNGKDPLVKSVIKMIKTLRERSDF